jgi:hypothetical protein
MPSYTPSFEGPIEGFVHNFLKRNFWRVAASMEYEDVLQEARLLFLELKQRYPQVDTPQWFMTLFKRSFSNHFHDLSKTDTDVRSGTSISNSSAEDSSEISLETLMGDPENAGYMTTLIGQAPEEVRSVLNLIANAPAELLELAIDSWKASGKKKELGNQMLCRMLGRDPSKTDLVEQVRAYFG